MDKVKKILTSWHVWAIIAIFFGFLLFKNSFDLASISPFVLLLVCPIMMIFMMRAHKDHKD